MTVAAVVVRWRGGDEVDRCLRSLLAQSGPDLGRIVDSGSGDGGAQRLAASYPEVEVIALAENRSFAHAANTGAAAITEDLIFLLNPDTEVEMGAVTTLVETRSSSDHKPPGWSRSWSMRMVRRNISGSSAGCPPSPAWPQAGRAPRRSRALPPHRRA